MEFIVSLIITAIAYGFFPLIFSTLRKKDITKKKYRTICYVVNIIVMIAFGVVNGGKMSLGPYLLWTTVFVWRGIHTLENRYVLDDPSDESDTVEVRKESAPSKFAASSERWRCDSIKCLSAPYQGTCLMCRANTSVAKYRIKNEVGTREIPICEDCANKFRGNEPDQFGSTVSYQPDYAICDLNEQSTDTKSSGLGITLSIALVVVAVAIFGLTFASIPAIRCSRNGHTWIEATCEQPKCCSVCGEAEGDVADHVWSPPEADGLRRCVDCGSMHALALPESGEVFIGEQVYDSSYYECVSTDDFSTNFYRALWKIENSNLIVESSSTESSYIKLKNAKGTTVFSFFVRAGETAYMSVPTGNYYVYFAHGDEWYGTKYLFGDNTTYTKDDELLDFENYTWTYTLYPVADGNFSETPISAEEFQ